MACGRNTEFSLYSFGGVAYVRNTEYGGDRNSESSLYTVNEYATGTAANRPYNGGVRNSEVRNIEVPLYCIHRDIVVYIIEMLG